MMILSTVSFAAPSAMGTFVTVGGEVVEEAVEATEVEETTAE